MAFASNQTSNYGLCQWEQTDLVVHSDFNEDNQKIDAALKDLADNKAEQSELDSLTSTVNGKASSSTVSSLSSRVSNLESTRATVTAMNNAVNGVAADVEDLSASCAMVVSGSYVGNGKFGISSARTLTFTGLNRTPLLVVVRQQNEMSGDALVLVNGMTKCMGNLSGEYSTGLRVFITEWGLNKVTWYSDSERAGMNLDGETYRYFAVG